MKWQCYIAIVAASYAAWYEWNRAGLGSDYSLDTILHLLTPSFESLKIISAYFAWLYALTFIVPGYNFQGPPLRDGRVLTFYCNGLPILGATVALYAGLAWNGTIAWTLAYDHYRGLLIWANIIALLTTTYLFIRGRLRELQSGHGFWEDFVMGQELVPQVLGLKLNFFWLRPSMMGWLFINLSFLAKHMEVNGGRVSHSMLLYQLFTNIYVVDYFVFEDFVTSTWDIIAEKFGYMLVWGDLVFIPFTFTLQAWFLINDRTYYSPVEIAGLVILFLSGYVIFRFANMQKHDFKKNPKALVWGRKPEILGERLLVSGWWGLASHINYLGDLILAVSYAAPCGLLRHASFIPWFYPIYLFTLLIHRDWRDDKKCSEKYGKLWQQYRKRVPYRILPYVY